MSHSGEAMGSYVDPRAMYPLMQSYFRSVWAQPSRKILFCPTSASVLRACRAPSPTARPSGHSACDGCSQSSRSILVSNIRFRQLGLAGLPPSRACACARRTEGRGNPGAGPAVICAAVRAARRACARAGRASRACTWAVTRRAPPTRSSGGLWRWPRCAAAAAAASAAVAEPLLESAFRCHSREQQINKQRTSVTRAATKETAGDRNVQAAGVSAPRAGARSWRSRGSIGGSRTPASQTGERHAHARAHTHSLGYALPDMPARRTLYAQARLVAQTKRPERTRRPARHQTPNARARVPPSPAPARDETLDLAPVRACVRGVRACVRACVFHVSSRFPTPSRQQDCAFAFARARPWFS